MRSHFLRLLPAVLLGVQAAALSTLASSSSSSSYSLVWRRDEDKKEEAKACTIKSPNSGNHFDLTPIHVALPSEKKKASKDERSESWHARGYDYGANFTINFCGPVVEDFTRGVEGIASVDREDIAAFYEKGGKTYSIGEANSTLLFRGRKLILTYTNGSPCDSLSDGYVLGARQLHNTAPNFDTSINDHIRQSSSSSSSSSSYSHDRNDSEYASILQSSKRRKSTIISLLCERDPSAPKAAISFVGASPDECAYFFEARSSAACPTVSVSSEQLGPSSVFGVIAMIAILVYLVGGIVYQRAVMHQRGWRQIPNYNIWAGMAVGLRDTFFRLFSCCTRCLPFRSGGKAYGRIPALNGNARHGRHNSDDENRLIDQLDEEWDD